MVQKDSYYQHGFCGRGVKGGSKAKSLQVDRCSLGDRRKSLCRRSAWLEGSAKLGHKIACGRLRLRVRRLSILQNTQQL